jgi:cysteine desulfuration protein SufE
LKGEPEKLRGLLEQLSSIDDRSEKIQLLIDTSRRFRPVPDRIAQRPFPLDHRAPACESEAYVWAEDRPDGTLEYHFAVENPQGVSAMALAVILRETLSGEPPERVAALSPDLIYSIFGRELSMGKTMGLTGMLHMVVSSAKERIARRAARRASG